MESFANWLVEVVHMLMEWLTTTLGSVAISIGEGGTLLMVVSFPGLLMYGVARLVVRGMMRGGFTMFDTFATLLFFAVVLAIIVSGGATGGFVPFLVAWVTAAVAALGMGLGSYRALGVRWASVLAATPVLLTPLFTLVRSL